MRIILDAKYENSDLNKVMDKNVNTYIPKNKKDSYQLHGSLKIFLMVRGVRGIPLW